jgi:hypothetical protein
MKGHRIRPWRRWRREKGKKGMQKRDSMWIVIRYKEGNVYDYKCE